MFQFVVCEKSQRRLVIFHKWQATLFFILNCFKKAGNSSVLKLLLHHNQTKK